MNNPWETIALSDYENHMRLDSVKQLQTLNRMMRAQLTMKDVKSATILGIAGGNGLEHVADSVLEKVYAVDVNAAYLEEVQKRYAALGDRLECLCLDLMNEANRLPKSDLVIANLLIEYIGYSVFQEAVQVEAPKVVSCIIQVNGDCENWVSDSPYLSAFDCLETVHHEITDAVLTEKMKEIGYVLRGMSEEELPNGKKLLQLDFGI